MLEGTVAIVEDADAIPQLGFLRGMSKCNVPMNDQGTYLGIGEMVEGLLVSCVSLLQVFHHQEAVTLSQLASFVPVDDKWSRFTQATPNFPIGLIQLQYSLQIFDRPREVLSGSQDTGDGVKSLD